MVQMYPSTSCSLIVLFFFVLSHPAPLQNVWNKIKSHCKRKSTTKSHLSHHQHKNQKAKQQQQKLQKNTENQICAVPSASTANVDLNVKPWTEQSFRRRETWARARSRIIFTFYTIPMRIADCGVCVSLYIACSMDGWWPLCHGKC